MAVKVRVQLDVDTEKAKAIPEVIEIPVTHFPSTGQGSLGRSGKVTTSNSVSPPQHILRQAVTTSIKRVRHNSLNRLVNALPAPKVQVKITDDIWYQMLMQSPELCYLCISGKVDYKHGYLLTGNHTPVPLESAFRVIPSHQHIPSSYPFIKHNGQIIAYSPQFANKSLRNVLRATILKGKNFVSELTSDPYGNLSFGESGQTDSNTGNMPPYQTFAREVYNRLEQLHISSAEFSRLTHLDYNVYTKLRNDPDYEPKRDTCKAILFAVRPNVVYAGKLFERAGYHFRETKEELLLLAFFALEDYDIEKYNQKVVRYGGTPLGSKNYKPRNKRRRK